MSTKTPDPAGYSAALSELEAILNELETDTVDVDVLATKVARASELVSFCRTRIQNAKVEVDAIVTDLSQE